MIKYDKCTVSDACHSKMMHGKVSSHDVYHLSEKSSDYNFQSDDSAESDKKYYKIKQYSLKVTSQKSDAVSSDNFVRHPNKKIIIFVIPFWFLKMLHASSKSLSCTLQSVHSSVFIIDYP